MLKGKLIAYILTIILGLFFLQSQAFCLELDHSIDSEINKKYNAKALDLTLPKLPVGLEPNELPEVKSQPVAKQQVQKQIATVKPTMSGAIKIKRGTKFVATSKTWASDSAKIGQPVVFTTTRPTTVRYMTIPTGSILRGRITSAHSPQITGNGGLVKIEIESITINGGTRYAEGKVTKANGKKIFINNIKGKRKYLASTGKNIKKCNKFFKKAMKQTGKFADKGYTLILSPITFIGGTIGYLGGVVVSPIIALKNKGERIALPPNTQYELKLVKDLYIYQ